MSQPLIGKPTIRPKIQKAKLVFCFLTAIMLVSLASIIVVVKIYDNSVKQQIQDIALLKDNNFKQWAQEPGSDKNSFTNDFVLYEYKGDNNKVEEDQFVLSNVSVKTFYNFTYVNTSFGQGNKGVVGLVNTWKREPFVVNTTQINNFNLVINKVFNEQTMSPIQSRFPVLFTKITKSLKNDFLPVFYTEYLWKFFLNDKNLVTNIIFKPLNFSADLQQKLLSQSVDYNWASIEGLRPWIKLCLSGNYIAQSYFLIKQQYGLTSEQMNSLIGSHSQMYYLTSALNATIRNKIINAAKDLCTQKMCTDEELIASQWANSYLTNNPFMDQINLQKLTGDVNKTHRKANIQFFQSCKFFNNSDNCLAFDKAEQLLTKPLNNLYNFSFVNFIVENKNSPAIVESILSLNQGEAKSVIDYVSNYFFNQYTLAGTNIQIFSWIWLVYQNFNALWSKYQDFFINNLFARAFYSKWANTGCADYFEGDLVNFTSVCNISGYKLGQNIQSYFPYISAYFYRDLQTFLNKTGMSLAQSQIFFHSPNSKFYTRIKEILSIFQTKYVCKDGQCSFKELAYRQWGSNDILSNLPSQYFTDQSISILEWDDQGQMFHDYNIEYWIVNNKKLTFQQVKNLMSYDEYGVLGEFSLKNRIDERKTKDPQEMIKYLNDVLINSVFGGNYVRKESHNYLFGYTDPYLQAQKYKDPLDGGKPWTRGTVSLIDLDNKDLVDTIKFTEYDQLNTGIFDTSQIRTWKKRLGRNATGYKYPVFMQNYNVTYTWIDTGRAIDGTNMLGFHTSVSSSDVLDVFVEDLKRNIRFVYDSTVSSNKLKFVPQKTDSQYFIGNDSLNGFYAQIIPNSAYIIVETATGQTIQAVIMLQWYIKPGRYLFDINQTTKAYLYQQTILFKRPNQDKYNKIISTRHTKKVILPILITVACLAFVGMIVVGFFIWRWRKSLIKLEDDIEIANVQKIDTADLRYNRTVEEDEQV